MLLCSAAIACARCAEGSNVMCVRIAGIATQLLDEELKLNLLVDRRSSSPLHSVLDHLCVHVRNTLSL